jgi:membrane protein
VTPDSATLLAVGHWERLHAFLRHGLWALDLDRLSPRTRLAVRLLQFVVVLARDYQRSALGLRAAALVYSTLLSLVPLLAVAFSVLKAFGVHQQLAPFLDRAFEPLGDQAHVITRQTVAFVSSMKVGVLGTVGVAGLFLAVILLLGKIEDAFNHIWRVRRARSLGRQFTDYLSVLLVGPVLIFTALGLTASAQNTWVTRWVLAQVPAGVYLLTLVGRVAPVLILAVAFTVLYRFMPNTHVHFSSAFVGGIVAALLWQLASVAFTAFVAASPTYAAIYSSFAILVLFFLWLQYAWLIVLVGAEVAYLNQHPALYLTPVLHRGGHHRYRERVALAALTAIAERHLEGGGPWRIGELAAELRVPPTAVEELLDSLVGSGVLLLTAEPPGIALARPPGQVTAVQVLDAVRGADTEAEGSAIAAPPVSAVLAHRDEAVTAALAGVTLETLARVAATRGAAPAPPRALDPGGPRSGRAERRRASRGPEDVEATGGPDR